MEIEVLKDSRRHGEREKEYQEGITSLKILEPNCLKMEEYEKFCERSLVRIQGESLDRECFPPVQSENSSLIQFHGVAALSPLLSMERRKEMQQERQKALNLEARRQRNRRKTLLNRVQEILENVQVRKASSTSDLEQWETEAVCPDSEVKELNGFTLAPYGSSPSLSEHNNSINLEEKREIVTSDTDTQFKLGGTDSDRSQEETVFPKQRDSPNPSHPENDASPKSIHSSVPSGSLDSDGIPEGDRESDPLLVKETSPDPYVMSLQNLLKKSRAYITREQARRSLRGGSKRSINESHSDKENDTAKGCDSVRERLKLAGKSANSVTLDKPSLNKSNILLQGASTPKCSTNTSALTGFCKAVQSETSSIVDSDIDEDLNAHSTFDPENSIIGSLSSSYANLPSPEPSLSPKMHRRRLRPLSTGHIVINNPVNAQELSPKGKGKLVNLVTQDVNEKKCAPEPVPKLALDSTGVCPGSKNISEAPAGVVSGKAKKTSQHSVNQPENKVIPVSATMEGQFAFGSRGLDKVEMEDIRSVAPRLHEPYASSLGRVSPKLGTVNGGKSTALVENHSCNSQVELNKSYDVENPSPLLMQSRIKRQQMAPPGGSHGNEQFLGNSFEKIKRRLDMDIDVLQKENSPYVAPSRMVENQERQGLPERRWSIGYGYITKNEILENSIKDGEEFLKNKMLAFEEIRKRLEEQHAQQLSMLIAEQEREQEKLQKEIEEQERRLKEKKEITAEPPDMKINSGVELEWRKISDGGLVDSKLPQVDTLHIANNAGLVNPSQQHSFRLANETPFYLWGSSAGSLHKMSASRPLGRAKIRWSQVFSPEMQVKFNKITAVAKGFLTRRLMQTEKLKYLQQTVKDTLEFIRSFQSEAPLKRGAVSAQDASLQERVVAQLRAALYDIHDIFFIMDAPERMTILRHDREVRREKMLRQMDKMKSPRERVSLSAATQKSLDRKKYMKVAEMGMPNKKILVKQKPSETRVLQPNQGQNTPIHRLLCRQGSLCRKNSKKAAKCCDNLRRQHSLG
ncbi:centriolar coiled-coil protein of 110 kDa isoform X2 [Tachyglossus aculeatus]|uniref:centriolar coiled-coil protein of 110 kDa isoform X2 n=1 Tax=Tachyglossus aculeatus TaxID=9261 RepID=UPI0018F32482|nr:centriolar coiled-coil protein of 110 kDa isoform X2 [Tachyglossus aculeatus]